MSLRKKIEAISSKKILLIIACGVWAIVLQNAGVIPRVKEQEVYVAGGSVDVDNTVGVNVGNTVDVNLGNTVDVNLEEINGKSNVFYDFGGNANYVRIPVYTGGWD